VRSTLLRLSFGQDSTSRLAKVGRTQSLRSRLGFRATSFLASQFPPKSKRCPSACSTRADRKLGTALVEFEHLVVQIQTRDHRGKALSEDGIFDRDDPGEPRSTWEMACSKSGQEESKRNWLPKRFRSVDRGLIFNEYFSRLSSGRPVRTHNMCRSQTLRAGTLKQGGYPAKKL